MADATIPYNRRDRNFLPVEEARRLFCYDAETGKLYWKYRPELPPHVNARLAGTEAGSFHPDRMPQVGIAGIQYALHRIAWTVYYGKIPPAELDVDHVDGNHENNKPGNLRLATPVQNSCNRAVKSDSSSKVRGVSWRSDNQKWRVTIQVDGKRHFLGNYATVEEASEVYKKAALELHGEFAHTDNRTKRRYSRRPTEPPIAPPVSDYCAAGTAPD